MKNKSTLLFLLAPVLTGCSGHVIYVWNIKDIIGLCILGLLLLIVGILFLRAWVLDTINSWKRKRKK